MKLRSHLVILVLSALLPVLAFSAVMGVVFRRQQRDAFEQRFLERVRAMRIALDRELEGHLRALRVLSHSPYLATGDLRGFYEQLRRVRAEQPAWSTVALMDPTGVQVFNLHQPFGAPLPKSALDAALLAGVAASGQPAVTPLVKGAVSGVYTTAIVLPVQRQGAGPHLLVLALDSPAWLRFLSSVPVIPGATMTLLDQNGIVIARTLNPDMWVGRRVSPVLYAKSRETAEAAYQNTGLEGQWFYTAHSRSAISGWTMATGVPVEDVEGQLRGSTLAMIAGAVLTAALAVVLALVFGRRISRPVSALAHAAVALERGERPPPVATVTAIAEVAEVARAFDEAAERLRAREVGLRASEAESRRLAAERARLLENERVAREEAETASRTKDDFLATLSHELRTPLNAVFGWARTLRNERVDPATIARGLASIERNSLAQVRLVEDLLDVSRIVTGKMRLAVRPVDLPAIVESAVEAIRQAAAAKQIRLETVLDPSVGPIMGDPDRLHQVVWNLVSNAVKFTPRSGRVQIRLARVDPHVEIVVSDTGQGIAAEVLPHVFERFRQADSSPTRAHGGLGLGLALVKHLVELHGGSVLVQSAGEGQGAVFTVRLPISPDIELLPASPGVHSSVTTKPILAPDASLEGVRVLVVDDERDTLELFERVLAGTGAEIETALSAAEAMARLERRRPDVILCDVGMPKEDGYALIRRVRTLSPLRGGDVPAVAVTAYGRVEDRVRLLAAGYNVHIAKPVDPAELIAVVANLVKQI
jgi:signal transduction histidine kinase/CheY-like chemotaxis protein